jgi:peptide-methionine (S)-S-oxide reductase
MAGRNVATLAGGCYWCLEAVYTRLRGVVAVECGFMGGCVPSPAYEQVCTDTTGYAEVVQVQFDPAVVSFRDLLEVFFSIHDPTTLNRQGDDLGSQYRSAIFFHTPEQEQAAREMIRELTECRCFRWPILTQVLPAENFYRAEDTHQGYFNRNANEPYCAMVVAPKLQKFRAKFAAKLKPE